jgi:hypothetical protein
MKERIKMIDVSIGKTKMAKENNGRISEIIREEDISDVVNINVDINATDNLSDITQGIDHDNWKKLKPKLYTAEELKAIGYPYSMSIGRNHYVFAKTDSSEQAIVKFIDRNGNGSGYAICEVIDGRKTYIDILRKYTQYNPEK